MTDPSDAPPPFYVDPLTALALRDKAASLSPSPRFAPATTLDAFTRQLFIPRTITDLYVKAQAVRLDDWEIVAIRHSLFEPKGLLARVLELKEPGDDTHPPYIRVGCTGRGDYDHLGPPPAVEQVEEDHHGDFGAAAVLEIWPGGHYSPIHSHGGTTGILLGLTGAIDIMLYEELDWNARKLGLMTLTPGQIGWLDPRRFAVHKVACNTPEGTFGASFHVYLNPEEALPRSRDEFDYVDEKTHEKKRFKTYSDLSWRVLRRELIQLTGRNERRTTT
jgi:hypothetical protein